MKQYEDFNVILDINEKNKEEKKIKKKKINEFFGKLVVIWFFISCIFMIYFSEKNATYAVMIFGQLFFVIGIFILNANEGKNKLLGIPLILVGMAIVVVPYLLMKPELLEIGINWENMGLFLGVLSFVVVGVVLLILPSIINSKLKRKCIESVNAKIINYEIRYSKHRKIYSPIYNFKYYDKEYDVSNILYESIKIEPIGTEVEIKINPDNPEEFYDKRKSMLHFYVLGILFVLILLPVLVLVLKEYPIIK